jgi:ribosomal-protein-alanine N-acetyltransferase
MQLYLTTQRLTIKPHTPGNLVWLNTLFNDPDEQYFNGDDPPKQAPETLEATGKVLERILDRSEDSENIDFAIHSREDDALIGCGMVVGIHKYNRRCALGISLGCDKGNWGKGYAQEALQAVISYCFTELDLNRIGVEIYEFNTRSIRLAEALGFHKEGVRRQYIFKDGVFKDEILYSLLREDWDQNASP